MAVATDMLQPVLAMAGLTAVVWIRMYQIRIGEMRRRRIDPQSIAGSSAKSATLQDTRASDNFVNLFEMPLLFHVAAFASILAGLVTPVSLALAWTYVALRAAHSLVQCTYNRVMHRFALYAVSSLLLFGWFGYLALYLQ